LANSGRHLNSGGHKKCFTFLEKTGSHMREKETLQAFLSPQRLYELAGPRVYARGEKYSAGGYVQLLEHSRDEAIAEVMG
jgi:hypothetical protein